MHFTYDIFQNLEWLFWSFKTKLCLTSDQSYKFKILNLPLHRITPLKMFVNRETSFLPPPPRPTSPNHPRGLLYCAYFRRMRWPSFLSHYLEGSANFSRKKIIKFCIYYNKFRNLLNTKSWIITLNIGNSYLWVWDLYLPLYVNVLEYMEWTNCKIFKSKGHL